MQEADVESWLEEEYQDVLSNAGLIQAEIKHQPMRLQVRLCTIAGCIIGCTGTCSLVGY